MVKNLPAVQETWVRSLGREDPWRREWHPLRCSCPESPTDGGACWAAAHGVLRVRCDLVTKQLGKDYCQGEMSPLQRIHGANVKW